ncbi:hypothetical protein [Halosolutus halophilus]|uniref:hypothetical protein n=1 Tax=Halosolutus halophilus TaxID=1552990 RepID=UPI0022352FF1|nr:hypothetical protein [Halosolutus halophilus]
MIHKRPADRTVDWETIQRHRRGPDASIEEAEAVAGPEDESAQVTVISWLAFVAICLLVLGTAFAIANGVIVP